MSKIVMKLDELTCPSCLQKIEGALNQQAGVKTAKVLFNAGKVKAEFDPTAVQAEQLADLVERLGYQVQSVKVQEEI